LGRYSSPMRHRASTTLMRAARLRVVLATLGRLLVILGILTAVPAILSLTITDAALGRRLIIVAVLEILGGWLLARLLRIEDIQWNEALAVTGSAFILAPLTMVWPLAGAGIAPLDAWFEAVSGVTTTGLTMLRGLAEQPADLLFLRAWMQWYGGLGIAVLTVALIMRHHASGRRLLETTGESLTHAGARDHARRVFFVYLGLTLLAIAAVWASGLRPFAAVLHGLAAVATGGFAPADESIAALPATSVAVLSLICLVAAVSLPLYARLRWRGPRAVLGEPEVQALIVAIAMTATLLAILGALTEGVAWPRALADGFALGISAQTDTGFSTHDVAALSPASQLVLMVSMTIGGCTGSTAGGIKLVRLLILIRLIQLALRRTAASERAVVTAHFGRHRIEPPMVAGALQLLGLWALILVVSWFIFLVHGQPPFPALFEVVSATANAGLSVGITDPELPALLKFVLTIDMLFGRVEVLGLLVLLYPPTWIGRRRAAA